MAVPKWIFNYRGHLASIPVILALFCFHGEVESEALVWALGIIICLMGVGVRLWAQQHIHRRLDAPKFLAKNGPYKLIRNPLYIGNILLCTGAVVTSEVIWLAPVALIWGFLTYSVVIRYEEGILLKKYGEAYSQFLSEVPRWFPKISGFKNMELELINSYFRKSFFAEVHCLLILLPFVLKEFLSPTVVKNFSTVVFKH